MMTQQTFRCLMSLPVGMLDFLSSLINWIVLWHCWRWRFMVLEEDQQGWESWQNRLCSTACTVMMLFTTPWRHWRVLTVPLVVGSRKWSKNSLQSSLDTFCCTDLSSMRMQIYLSNPIPLWFFQSGEHLQIMEFQMWSGLFSIWIHLPKEKGLKMDKKSSGMYCFTWYHRW